MNLDIISAWRQIRSKPLFNLTIVLILALGIGANLAIFSLLNALLFKPLPVRNAGDLLLLEQSTRDQLGSQLEFSYRQFEEVAKHPELFAYVVAEQVSARSNSYPMTSSGDGDITLVTTQIVSPNYFSALGVGPLIGRVLAESDANPLNPDIPAVISYNFWRTKLGAAPAILGRHIKIKRFPFVIVGVLPQSFHSIDIDRSPDVRLPISAALPLLGRNVDDPRNDWDAPGFCILAHLGKAVNPEAAAEAILLELRSTQEFEIRERNKYRPRPFSSELLSEEIRSSLALRLKWLRASAGVSRLRERFSRALKTLMSAVAVLLALVVANVTTLMLTKAEPRRKEMAVRLALGASRGHLARQLMTEAFPLTVVGAAAGAGLAHYMVIAITNLLPATRGADQQISGRLLDANADGRVLTFLFCIMCFAMVGSSALPLRLAIATKISPELRGFRHSGSQAIWTMLPVVIQVALSSLLALQGALSFHNYLTLERLNPGFERKHILSVTIESLDQAVSGGRTASVLTEARTQVSQLAGIESVGYARWGLMRGSGFKFTAAPRGVILPGSAPLNASLNLVSPSFFKTLGIPLLSGRNLTDFDRGGDSRPTPIVINQAFAKLLFPNRSPVGLYLGNGIDAKSLTNIVVGVVADTKYRSMQEPAPPTAYALLDEGLPPSVVMYVRGDKDPMSSIAAIRRVFRALGPYTAITEVSAFEQEVQGSLWQERLISVLSGAFSLTSIALAALGIYAALTFSIDRRIREFGIRMAVGARPREIIRSAGSHIGIAVSLGFMCGWIISRFWLSRTEPILLVSTPFDRRSFAIANLIVLVCAAIAAVRPLWRISRMNAMDALKHGAFE